jgi:imidazolonepropionase-like amidohydrolase
MRTGKLAFGALLAVASCSTGAVERNTPPAVTIFEGARLIPGDSSAPIPNSAFVVESGRFTRVGRKGDIQIPAGAGRVDLTGKTVIPALIDAHSHIGYMKDLTSGPQNYTREHIVDHMYRFAYHGVAASQAMGSDFGDMPFTLRDDLLAGKYPGAARFLTAGRGLAPLSEISPHNMRHAAYPITTEEGARAAVGELAARNVKIVKTWVDDRGGTVQKLAPNLYRAIIDEAHKHNLRVVVHATGLDDAKDLVRAGVDGFAHMVSDIDDELLRLLTDRPNVFFLLALGGPRRTIYAPWLEGPDPLVAETVSVAQIQRLRDRLAKIPAEARERARMNWERLSRGVAKLNAAGVRIGLGTDGGGQTGDQFVGWTVHTELENMVAAGMRPAEAIEAATKTSAGILALDDLGMVAAGKSGDFVVLDADPLDDITNTRRISRVYLRGAEVNRTELRAKWTGRFSH